MNDKYDRQTRLWGEGQILISRSRIICFGSDGAATEILKNLILAGVGYVVIVDDKKVENEDISENFFVNSEDLGKNRAEVCLENLLELNPEDVKGAWYRNSVENFFEENIIQLQTFDVVIVCNKQDRINSKLITYAENLCQRVIIVRNFGLINYIRIFENFHGSFRLGLTDNPVIDLRIVEPWDELKNFSMGINLEELDEKSHTHVPYLIILIQALEKFKNNNSGKLPLTREDKNELKLLINSMRKFENEDNFNEAINFYYYATLPSFNKINLITEDLDEIFEILNQHPIEDLIEKSNLVMSNFFIICKALQTFYKIHNTLPVVGNIPDMTSDSQTYISLKKIYDKKSKQDRDIMKKIVFDIISNLKTKNLLLRKEQIMSNIANEDLNFIEMTCKNWPQISILNYSSIVEEELGIHYFENDFDEEHDKRNFLWYLLIKAADLYYEKFNRYPGEMEDFQIEIPNLRLCLNEFIQKKSGNFPEISEDLIFEFCRMSNSKIVPAISIISSIASQEIIKLITYQFKSINNTVVYDGINTNMSIFKF